MKLAVKQTVEEVFSVFLKDVSSYGGIGFYTVAILFFLMTDLDFAMRLAISLITITIAVAAVRLTYFKPRPGMKKRSYLTYYERIDNSSFPSIHAARAILISLALYTLAPAITPLFLFLTAMVCASRIFFRRHDYVDITTGLVLGAVLGYVFFIA